jgi:sugar phosphate isomerase/epimerase
MKLGIGAYTYVWAVGVPGYPPPAEPLTHRALLERAATLGVRVVQFADHLPLDRLSAAELTALRARAAELGLTLEAGTSGLGRDHLARCIATAAQAGARLLRTLVDTANHQPTEAEAIALLRAAGPLLEAHDVTLAVENHDRLPVAALRRILDAVDHPRIGACLDTANSLACSEGPDLVLDTLGPRAVCLHLKDYTIRRLPHRFGFVVEGCPLGAGQVDAPRWLARLRVLDRDVSVILELWPAPEATPAASIEKEARWVAQSLAYLRPLLSD